MTWLIFVIVFLAIGAVATWAEEGTGQAAEIAGRIWDVVWKVGLVLLVIGLLAWLADSGFDPSPGGDPYNGPTGDPDYSQQATQSGYSPGGDIDCDQVNGPIAVGSSDPNNLDADGDGIGCER